MKLLLSFLTISLMNAGNEDHMTPDRPTSTAKRLFSDIDSSTETPNAKRSRGYYKETMLPPPSTPTDQQTVPVDPTPGMTVSQEQADLFTHQKSKDALMESDFANIIGEDNMEVLLAKLGDTDIEQTKAWNMLSDMSVEFDNSTKRNYINIIKKYLADLYGKSIDIDERNNINTLVGQISLLQISAQGVPSERLAKHVVNYCNEMQYELEDIRDQKMKTQDVKLENKKEGRQLGYVVKVNTDTGKLLTYYAKTHSEGTFQDVPSEARSAQPVNYIELLTYKLLEKLGIGPQSHFFGRDERNFYIMTLDLAINPKTMESLGKFLTFGKINKSEEKENYLGKLSEYKYKAKQNKSDPDYVKLINEIENDEKSKKFCYEITKMNLLVRIIYMTDLHDNSGNFGFIIDDQGGLKELKIVDMHAWLGDHPTSVKSFMTGNGIFVAATSTPSVIYAFKARDTKLRLQDAQNIMYNELNNFESALKQAYDETVPMISKHYEDDADKAEIEIEALEERCKGILENYDTLQKEIPIALTKLSTSS